mmetsp:Transcript_848/g.1379  ORF Transcript_848/g.1379 Transcript_848/m.1379 type:complete len:136 (-) Transcript_848:164-571(-)
MACCSNMICVGFDDANQKREMKESLHPTCLFWRHPTAGIARSSQHECYEKNRGEKGIIMVHLSIGKSQPDWATLMRIMSYRVCIISKGQVMDEKNSLCHSKQVAIGGHTSARNNLGAIEKDNGWHESKNALLHRR